MFREVYGADLFANCGIDSCDATATIPDVNASRRTIVTHIVCILFQVDDTEKRAVIYEMSWQQSIDSGVA